jgi:hypothetical protein
MVQVKYGAIITDMKGKIGGQTFKGNFTAASCQNINKKLNRVTDFNQTPRNNLAFIAASWRELTEAQRGNWNTLALTWPFVNCFGVEYFATGYQVFLSVNCNLLSVGEVLHTDTAERVADFVFTNVSGVWSSVFNNCTFTFDDITALGNWVILFLLLMLQLM